MYRFGSDFLFNHDHWSWLYALKAPTQNLNRKADPCDVAADVSAVQTSERPTDTGSCIKRLVANKVSRSGATPPWWWRGHHSARRGAAHCQKSSEEEGQAWLPRSRSGARAPQFGQSEKCEGVQSGAKPQECHCIAAADFPKSRTAPRAGYFTSSGHFDVVKHVYFVNVSCLCMSTSKSYIEYQAWGMSGVCL